MKKNLKTKFSFGSSIIVIGLVVSGLLLAAEIIFNLWSLAMAIFIACFSLILFFVSIFYLLIRARPVVMAGFIVFLIFAIFHFMAITVI